jgi:PEGA domain
MKGFFLPRVSVRRRMRARAFVLVCAVALGAAAAPRHVASPAEIAVARRLFREATALEKAQKWDDAVAKLQQVVAIKETPGVRYHLAYCEEHGGHWVEALDDYDRAAELLHDGAKAPDVARLLGPARDTLKKRVPTLTVNVPTNVSGASLLLDGKPVAPELVGQATPLNPGAHALSVTAPGHQPFSVAVTLKEGEARVVDAKLPAAPATPAIPPMSAAGAPAPAPVAPPEAEQSRALPPRTIVLIGEGVITAAGLGLGIGYTLAASSASSDASDARAAIDRIAGGNSSACANPTPQVASACNALHGDLSDHDHDQTIAVVGFIGAGVGAAAAIVTWFAWHPNKSQQALSFGATPLAGGGAYWTARGTF